MNAYETMAYAIEALLGEDIELWEFMDHLDGFRNYAFTTRDQGCAEAAMRVRVMFELRTEECIEEAVEWFDAKLDELDTVVHDRMADIYEATQEGNRK